MAKEKKFEDPEDDDDPFTEETEPLDEPDEDNDTYCPD